MIKTAEIVVIILLIIFSFIFGVKYSDSVKKHAGWLFEAKEEEIELPDLINETAPSDSILEEPSSLEGNSQAPIINQDNSTEIKSGEIKNEASSTKNDNQAEKELKQ
jgi:hypothetical protein